jgi:CRISPR-associated endonuclease Cas2
MEKIYLISYDISNDGLRLKVSNKLLYYGMERIQYSVFAGSMRNTLFQEADTWLKQHIKGKDRLIILPLPPQISQNILSYGEYTVNWDFLTNQQNTLYLD